MNDDNILIINNNYERQVAGRMNLAVRFAHASRSAVTQTPIEGESAVNQGK